MSRIGDLLHQLEAAVLTVLPKAKPLFEPGVDRDAVDRQFAKLLLLVPETIYELYAWHDGMKPDRIVGDWRELLMPIRFVAQHYEVACSAREFWKPEWLPVFHGGANDYWGVDCSGKRRRRDGAVIEFAFDYVDPEPPQVVYEGVENMIATFVDAFEHGAFSVSKKGTLIRDEQAFRKISRKHNPALERWSGE